MKSLVSVCAWCDSVKTPVGWMAAKSAFQIMGIQSDVSLQEMTHGICPSCVVEWTKIDEKSFETACQQESQMSSLVA
ncbi:MAG: hypothetical protein HQM13_00745 [SAR324 cluster bacterium]|nr:hypothetical protein [SAR324 cluster bacterium]